MMSRMTFTFHFNDSNFRMCHCIRILPDCLIEGAEFFGVCIARVDPRIANISTRVKIVDDDCM